VGSFSFQKTAAYNGQALNGATFTLTSTDGTITKTAVSGANGTDGEVSFTNIPSGYTYTLTETAAPTGYDVNSTVYNVAVAYGQVTENVPDTVTNDLTQTYKDITITKIWQKPNTVSTKPITVQLLQDGSAYAQYTLSASDVTVSSDGNTWTYTFRSPTTSRPPAAATATP
jgi:uncharacterized surface anchored protein